LDDAQRLLAAKRYDNSAYLAGYVAECALKVLLVAPAPSPKAVGHDLSTLTTDSLLMLWVFAPAMQRYSLPGEPEASDLVRDWKPELRYSATGTFSDVEATRWVIGAGQLFQAFIAEPVLDGWSPMT